MGWRPTRRWVRPAAVALAVGVTGVGGAIAGRASGTTTVPDLTGIIHGCIDTSGALHVIVLPGARCSSDQTEVSWNQIGQPGPQGKQGGTGPQGPRGGTGPEGRSGPQGQLGHTGPQGVMGPSGVGGFNNFEEFLPPAGGNPGTPSVFTTAPIPAGVTHVYIEAWGGGGGGGGATSPPPQSSDVTSPSQCNGGGGGGAGGYIRGLVAVTPGTRYQVVVGSGGTGGLVGNPGAAGGFSGLVGPQTKAGGTGSTLSVQSLGGASGLAVANGGTGGAPASAQTPGTGGAAGGGRINGGAVRYGGRGADGLTQSPGDPAPCADGGTGGTAAQGSIDPMGSQGGLGGGLSNGGDTFGSAGASGYVLLMW